MEYFKIIVRRLWRYKVYAVINVVGLTIALTSVLLIYSHIAKEWKTDRFHKNLPDIYRVLEQSSYTQRWESITSAPVAPYTQAEFPGIKDYVRVAPGYLYNIHRPETGEIFRNRNIFFTDKQFFSVFSFPLLVGDAGQDWGRDWLVISGKAARKMYGKENPVGQTLLLKMGQDEEDKGKEYRIVAVMEDIPAYSSLQADFIFDFTFMSETRYDSWGMHGLYTYFLLDKNCDRGAIEKAIPQIVEKNYHWIEASEHRYRLQPLAEIYMESDYIRENVPHGSKRLNAILGGISLLILMLAAGNYLMIAMAQLHARAPGIVMQRCLGAGNRRMFLGIFLETGIYMLLALMLSGIVVVVLHPWFAAVISPQMPYALSLSLTEILLYVAIVVLVTLGIAGLLSGWTMHRINRHSVREILQHFSGKADLKDVLSVLQMCIFCALLCCSVILVRQMNFVEHRKLGFNTEEVIGFFWRTGIDAEIESVRNAIMSQIPDILAFSNGEQLPIVEGDPGNFADVEHPGNRVKAYMVHGDAFYLDLYQIQLTAGRNIRKESYPTRGEDFCRVRDGVIPEILVNEEFVRQLGEKDILGRLVKGDREHKAFRVVGIVKDFHFQPLYESVQPMYIIYDMPFVSYVMLVRYREGKRQEVLASLQKLYEEQFTNSDFGYSEYNFSQLYDKDIALVRLINIFTLIAILIGGMGVLALSMFMAESRQREIALRKVNGAGLWQIMWLLNLRFLWRMLLACAVGLPVAHYAMRQWLMGFAYTVELNWGMYAGVVLVCVAIVFLIITWQVRRAARINPVEILKYQ